ncbi:MAG: undecaprenyl-diphosphate phosphatase [Candidatus Methylomirabilales bacterium]
MIPGRFSFLLGIPAIGAAGLFELRDLLKQGLEVAGLPTLTIGILASTVSGYLAINFLLRYLRTRTMYVFVGYRIALGLFLLVLLALGVMQPLG